MTFKVKINSQVTIFQEETIFVCANDETEAKEMAEEGFREIMDAKFGWADYDTTNIEECVKC